VLGEQIVLIEIYESGRGRRPSTYATDIKIKSGMTFSSLTRVRVQAEPGQSIANSLLFFAFSL